MTAVRPMCEKLRDPGGCDQGNWLESGYPVTKSVSRQKDRCIADEVMLVDGGEVEDRF